MKKLVEKHTKHMHVRFKPTEIEAVKARAKALGMTVSKYIRLIAVNGEVVDYRHLIPLQHELRKIGNNINQVAAMGNKLGYMTDKQSAFVVGELKRLKNIITVKIGEGRE